VDASAEAEPFQAEAEAEPEPFQAEPEPELGPAVPKAAESMPAEPE
jgi:hypothetical protein